MKRSEILGLEGAAVNQVGLQYCLLFMHKSCMNQTKEVTVSCSLGHQTLWNSAWVSFQTPRWPAKGVTWSSLMRSSWNPPLLGTTIWSTPSELQCVTRGTPARCVTQNCGSLDHAMHKKWAISLSEMSCYAFDKHCRNYGSTNTVLHAPMWYSADSWVATPREALPMLKWHPQI